MENVLQNNKFKMLMHEHIEKVLTFLLTQNQPFAVVCYKKALNFTPMLPDEIYNSFSQKVLFILKNHSLESATLQENALLFEAGFGAENYGSTVFIPLLAIEQIYIDDTPILLSAYTYKEDIHDENDTKKSMEMLLKNPKNRALFKK